MKNTDNPFVDSGQRNAMVDMKGGVLIDVDGVKCDFVNCLQMLWS